MKQQIDHYLHTALPREAIQHITRGGCLRDTHKQRANVYKASEHLINDRRYRPDKVIPISPEDEGAYSDCHTTPPQGGVRIERVNRIALSIQKRIVESAVAFTFGNPVVYNATPRDEGEQALLEALETALRRVRSSSLDRQIARHLFAFCEVAEYWYPTEVSRGAGADGTRGETRLRVQILSPALGDRLYPYFDEYGDLVAFARGYDRTDTAGKTTPSVDVFTADYLYRYEGGEMAEGYPRPNVLGKIPIVYAKTPQHETAEVDGLIDRLELLLSNFSDTNDYHASPKIFISGEMRGFLNRGEAGAIIEGEAGARAEYLSWASAPEAVRLEIDTLLRMIYSLTQTPDISFESVKGLGAMSGVALKLLFMDAHLKVQAKRELLDEYLSRRVSVITAYLAQIKPELRGASGTLDITPEITPYIITSDTEDLDYWQKASGGKALISHKEAIARAGLSQDPETTLQAIQDEERLQLERFATEPTAF